MVTANLSSHSDVPNLFGLPALVYTGTVPDGAPSTAPMAAACVISAPVARVDKSGSDTALRAQCLANYEARLRHEGSDSQVPNAMALASIPRGIGHSQVARPGADSTCNPLLRGEPTSPWTHHQDHARELSAYAKQTPVGGHHVGEDIPRVNAWFVACHNESMDDNYQPSIGAQSHNGAREPGLAHPGITRKCQERLSHRDWYEAPARPTPAPLPRQEEFGVPRKSVVDWGDCQTISTGTFGANARLPERWECDARHVQ